MLPVEKQWQLQSPAIKSISFSPHRRLDTADGHPHSCDRLVALSCNGRVAVIRCQRRSRHLYLHLPWGNIREADEIPVYRCVQRIAVQRSVMWLEGQHMRVKVRHIELLPTA